MKKRYIFYAVYIAVTVACTMAALILNPFNKILAPPTPQGDLMLMIAGALIGIMLIFLVIVQIKKKILIKLKKLAPDEPYTHQDMKAATDTHVAHSIMMTGGLYNEKYDKAVSARKKRSEEQMKK